MADPVVLPKGYDEAAPRIKAIASEHSMGIDAKVQLVRAVVREVQITLPEWTCRN